MIFVDARNIDKASLFLKACIAALLLGGSALLSFMTVGFLSNPEPNVGLFGWVCIGPFAVITFILFLVTCVWFLNDLKNSKKETK